MSSPPPGSTLLDRMRAAQVTSLYRNVAPGVIAAAVSAIALGASLAAAGGSERGLLWAGFICLCAAAHVGLRWRWGRAADRDSNWRWWAARFVAIALAEGLGWGWASVGLVPFGHYDQLLLVLIVTYCVAGGAIPAFGSYRPALWAFFLPATTPFAVSGLLHGGPQYLPLGALATIYVVGMGAVGRRASMEFDDSLRLRFEVDELAIALRTQKDMADEANLAKSRFLAAASHDLRQPVHALSLSVGALQGMAMAPEVRTLVGHIESSVEALDGLFTALLDISRLDAAVITPQPRAFAIQPLLARVCREHAAEASVKGVQLRLVPSSLAIRTDPALFEGILRNLVANAVRYTDRGRVLVGCHPGIDVRVEIRDTGRGIPAALHEKVFEEFFQVGNPARDRAQGIGLGLAIVRRLTRLLDIPLTLDSVEGRGSVFTLSVPRAAAPDREPAADVRLAPMERGALILVIDDEPAILTAMRSLLMGWGHQVIAAGSGEEMLRRLATCTIRPALLICDYRLRDGEDGIATVQRLQSEYNDDLPAILITGDTGPERLLEAEASGLTLLHKPVEHGRLRRVIARALTPAGSLVAPPLPPGSG